MPIKGNVLKNHSYDYILNKISSLRPAEDFPTIKIDTDALHNFLVNPSSSSDSGTHGTSEFMSGLANTVKSWDTSGSNTFFGGLGAFFNKAATLWDDYVGNTANRENIAYQKEYNEQVFDRADTQYQRTVADLRAAGLSGQLAAGAPSTVAGQSAAPQRSVGNESQAIDRLIGMITSMKQTNANVQLINAQKDKVKAEEDYINSQNSWYGAKTASEIAKNEASARQATADAVISEQYGENFLREFNAKVDNVLQDTENKKASEALARKQLEYYDAQTGVLKKTGEKINQEIKNLQKEYWILFEKVKQEVYNTLGAGYKAETALNDSIQAALNTQILQYNFDLSQEWNMRTTDAQSKFNIFGLSWGNAESLLNQPRTDVSPVTGQQRKYGQ